MMRIGSSLLAIGLALPLGGAATRADVPLAWPFTGSSYRVEFLGSVSSEADLAIRRGLFSKLLDLAAGPPEQRMVSLSRPLMIATDPQGRLLVADPGTAAVHIFDAVKKSHKALQGPSRQRLQSPVGVDSDSGSNIYVADSAMGRIFVFDKEGKFTRFIGYVKGEGIFKRPTGLSIDRKSGRIYLTDTLQNRVFVLNGAGAIERQWGFRGSGPGEFNYPTAVVFADGRVFVLDTMNFRVQVFSPEGLYQNSFGHVANEPGGFFRPKGLAVDTQKNRVYVVDAMFEAIQAFTLEGKLVWAFGHGGSKPGEFSLPAGVCIHPDGRILIADSYNRRVQMFRVLDSGSESRGAER